MPRHQGGTRLTKRTLLLCAFGCGMKLVTFIDPSSYNGSPIMSTRVILACGHERGELLPVHPGSLSFENFGTGRGDLAFPVVRDER
jgi:hypothetical protein